MLSPYLYRRSSSMIRHLSVSGTSSTRRSTRAWAPNRRRSTTTTTTTTTGGGVATKSKDPLEVRKMAQEARQQRANQLHDEIAAITQKQDKRHGDDVAKTKSFKGFTEFLSNNKTNVSVIVVSFLTVVLSVKLVQGKQQYRQLQEELNVVRAQGEEKRQVLTAIASDEFLQQLAYQCAVQVEETGPSSSTYWTWGGGGSSSHTNTSSQVASTLHAILRRNLSAIIGDVALTDDQKNTQQLLQLTVTGQQQQLPIVDDAIQKLAQEQSASKDNHNKESSWVPESPAGVKSKKKSVFVI